MAPYLVLMFLVAALATVVVTRLVSGALEQRFANQLLDAGKNVNDNVLKVEAEQAELLRLMVNARGVPEAVSSNDARQLQLLLVPLQFNTVYDMVDVLDAQGQEVLALRPAEGLYAQAFDPAIGSWELVRKILSGASDEFGDKHSDLVQTSYGPVFYTAAAVRSVAGISGAILVGVPADQLLVRLTKDTLANVTLYDPNGALLLSTLPVTAGDASLKLANPNYLQGVREGSVTERTIRAGTKDYLELVGGLVIRDRIAVGLGVALPTDSITTASQRTRIQLALLFSSVVVAVIIMAVAVARRLTRPIAALVQACRRVSIGNLDGNVVVKTEDETGVLADTFNDMLAGLRERNFIKETFGRYMHKSVSEAILSGDLKLGGERKEVTLLMSDIRGFTSISEGIDPGELVAFLNRYFASMVDCVLTHDGVVDKYMGDAILAVYGTPLPNPFHARCAVLTALQMRDNLELFNIQLAASGHPPVRVGVGVNTGPVIAGNIGSELRMEYTVIGDTVNATQRIEDLTKDFAVDILISDTTYAVVRDEFDFGQPFTVTLRGKTQEMMVYPVLGMRQGLIELVSDQGPTLVAADAQDAVDALLGRTPAGS